MYVYFNKRFVIFSLETERMGKLLDDINSTTNELKSRFEKLSDDINKVNANLSSIYSESLTTGADFSVLPNVQEQLNNINDINNDNLTQKAQEVSLKVLSISSSLPSVLS